MKKSILLLIILIIIIVITSIIVYNNLVKNNIENNTDEIIENDEDEEIEVSEEQLEIIADSIDLWKKYENKADEVVQFIVTDLDCNGRLEVIVSQMGGSGKFSYNYYYEVNEDLDGMAKCSISSEEGDSEVDFIASNEADVYHDKKDDIYYYIINDEMKVSADEHYNGIYAVSLKEGKISEKFIASKIISYDYENDYEEIAMYSDANEKNITEAEYNSAVNNYFIDCDKSTIKFNWNNLFNLDGLSKTAIIERLKDSLSL